MSAARPRSLTPAQAALYGSFAGLTATILVSLLARATPQLRTQAFIKTASLTARRTPLAPNTLPNSLPPARLRRRTGLARKAPPNSLRSKLLPAFSGATLHVARDLGGRPSIWLTARSGAPFTESSKVPPVAAPCSVDPPTVHLFGRLVRVGWCHP